MCKDEKISQDPLVQVFNGTALKLHCSHPSPAANENVFWYRQFPNHGPRFLVQSYKGSKSMEEPRGALIVADDRKSSILSITRVTLEDSALYFRWVWCKEEKVMQDSQVVTFDGKELNLYCSHPSAAASETVFWYRQFPNQGPHFLISNYKGRKLMKDPKGALIVAEDRKSSILSISRVVLEDSAVYFCALSDTVLHSGAPTVQEAFLPSSG
ncbi:hypothetical protein lerEdw1_011617 [Lerista edwardsae]|nr:hypothetical protein lerEdw1_011617 [Lerista edwardsae]